MDFLRFAGAALGKALHPLAGSALIAAVL